MQKNPVKAIRDFCLDCCGGSSSAVKECSSVGCALYSFRLGKNPFRVKREMSDEQKDAARIRLAEARKQKSKDIPN